MRQVLFWLPIPWTTYNVPIYGFGMMLFVAFVVCTWLAARRARREGVAPELLQDLSVWIFVGGIVGARIVFMIQYQVPLWQFYRIWEGGLVFYGSAAGGLVGYLLAYFFIIRKLRISTWQLADIVAPSVALGLCLGRVGCLLNGCCYGNVACSECAGVTFPLSAPPRFELVKSGLQTAAGFATLPSTRTDRGMTERRRLWVEQQAKATPRAGEGSPIPLIPPPDDPVTVVAEVEPDSAAARAGLRPHDWIVGVEGKPNRVLVVEPSSNPEALTDFDQAVADLGPEISPDEFGAHRYQFANYDSFGKAKERAAQRGLKYGIDDELESLLVPHWPRGKSSLQLKVRHADGVEESLPPFSPQTLRLHPTQIYESISMALLVFLLLAFYPFRPAKGAVMILLMLCYSVHRYINESLRNDTAPVVSWPWSMTLSQVVSILMFTAGVSLGLFLWYQTKGQKKVAAPELVAAH